MTSTSILSPNFFVKNEGQYSDGPYPPGGQVSCTVGRWHSGSEDFDAEGLFL